MLFKIISVVVFAVFLVLPQGGDGHTYHVGGCPTIEPAREFNINGMLGIWYVIQKTSTASYCLTYNFTKTDEPGEYKVEEVSQHFLLGLTPLKHGYHYTGTLRVIDSTIPAKMRVSFPLNVAGSAVFTIFDTDYDRYAGIFTCQKLSFAHRQSAVILSREKTLDKLYVDKLRSKLSAANIDPFSLSIIRQTECPKNQTEGYNININDETISTKAAADVLRKTGEKIGDGFEYVADKTKDIYHKIADSKDDVDKMKLQATPDPNAEWLP